MVAVFAIGLFIAWRLAVNEAGGPTIPRATPEPEPEVEVEVEHAHTTEGGPERCPECRRLRRLANARLASGAD